MAEKRIPFKEGGRPLPFQMLRGLAASVAPARGQMIVQNSSGYALLGTANLPNCIPLGPADRDEDAGTGNGDAKILTWNTFVSGYAASTVSGDALTDSDFGVVAWVSAVGTPGKKSNSSGNNHSIWGLCFGLDKEAQSTPLTWTGPIAWCVARGVHIADNESGGSIAYAVDASASTDQGSAADPLLIPRKKTHGRITSIEIIPSADLALALTNYRVITIYKIDTLTNTVGPVVGTFSTLTQNLAKRTPTQFTLSSTSTDLDVLETDVFGYASLHTASGATVPQSVIRINMKVQ